MRLAILSRAPDLYSTRRLVEAAEARGHEVQVLDTLRCTAHLTANGPEGHYHGERLDPPDAIIPRIGSSITFYGLSIVRQFEAMGVWTLNSAVGITRSRNKLRAHYCFYPAPSHSPRFPGPLCTIPRAGRASPLFAEKKTLAFLQ